MIKAYKKPCTQRIETVVRVFSVFHRTEAVQNPREERQAEALREKEQEAPGQRSPGTSGVQEVFQERESFCEGNFK